MFDELRFHGVVSGAMRLRSIEERECGIEDIDFVSRYKSVKVVRVKVTKAL